MENKFYIRCLDRTSLIKFLKDENYTQEADILKPRDIDGMRFLELTELDLVAWNLTNKQRKLLLNCRDKIVQNHSPQTIHKTQLQSSKSNFQFNKISKQIEAKMNFHPNGSGNTNVKSSNNVERNKSINNNPILGPVKGPLVNRISTQYVDMTKNPLQFTKPVNTKKSDEIMQTNASTNFAKKVPIPDKQKIKSVNAISSENNNTKNFVESELDYESPNILITKNEMFSSKPSISQESNEDYLIADGKQSGSKCNLILPFIDKPTKSLMNMNNPPFIENQNKQNFEIYEDPDDIDTNPLISNINKPRFDTEADHRLPKGSKILNNISAQPAPPPLPVRPSREKITARNEPMKIKHPTHNKLPPAQRRPEPLPEPEEESIYEVEPEPKSDHIYEVDPLESNSKCSKNFDMLRPKHILPPPSEQRPKNFGFDIKTTINKPGMIWNISDENDLPKPPTFEKRFEQTQLNMVRKMIEADEEEIVASQTNFNPNNYAHYRSTTRTGAKRLLERIPNLADGAFVVRDSKEYYLAITMYYQKRFYNVGINRNSETGTFYCNTDEESEIKLFKTLEDLTEHYKQQPIIMLSKGKQIRIYLKEQLPSYIF